MADSMQNEPNCLASSTIPLNEKSPQYAIRRQTVGAFALFHLLLPLAAIPWFFSWAGLLSVFIGNFVFGSLGICLYYHRTLTHGSVKLPNWLGNIFAVLGICNLQDSPCHWVALHRLHHKHSDADDDPHSPMKNFFWGHVGWLFVKRVDAKQHRSVLIKELTPDLLKNPFLDFVEQHNRWSWIFAAHAVLFFAGGTISGRWYYGNWSAGFQFGCSMLVWGVIVRVVYTWHMTWSVNSLAHTWGYRNYETRDQSRNNWLVALVTWGEGWHNNHHADQRSAAHGHRWWELDVTYMTIRLLERCGLAWEIIEPRSQQATESEQVKRAA